MASPLPLSPTVSLTVHLTADPDQMTRLLAALRSIGGTVTTAPEPRRPTLVPVAPLRIAAASRRVLWRGEDVTLTRLEFDLLLYLAANPGRVHRRRALMAEVWQTTYVSERTVDVHIRRLRGKTDMAVVRTVRGVGYQFGDPSLVVLEDQNSAG